jgi:hypothetical protein
MKKYILFTAIFALAFASCDMKEDYEEINSEVVEAAGEWYVLYNHSQYGVDAFGVGLTAIITYNTSADDGTEIWLSDEGNFWEYKVKLPVNLATMTFGSDNVVTNEIDGYDIGVRIMNGKILKDASTYHDSGATADSIYFELWFEDLEAEGTGIANDTLYVSGFRRTGFMEDEPH